MHGTEEETEEGSESEDVEEDKSAGQDYDDDDAGMIVNLIEKMG